MSEELRKKLGIEENEPNQWFETLYAGSNPSGEGVPWANLAPHPLFKEWIDQQAPVTNPSTALVIGCGLGDDAIALAEKGYQVTAFDVSQSAIDICRKRFPDTAVNFQTADLLQNIPEWHQKFDFVLEIFTVQALPPKYETTLIQHIVDFVSNRGQLMVITEVNAEERDFKNGPPWLLHPSYISSFEQHGLKLAHQKVSNETEIGEEIHRSIFTRNNS